VNFLAKMRHIGADRQWNGAIGIEFVAGTTASSRFPAKLFSRALPRRQPSMEVARGQQ
jgi:hypothetical protein